MLLRRNLLDATNTFSSTTIAQADYGMESRVFDLNRDGAALVRWLAVLAALFAVLAVFDVLGAVVIWTVLKNKSADDDTTPLETSKPATQS